MKKILLFCLTVLCISPALSMWKRDNIFNPEWEKNPSDFQVGVARRQEMKSIIENASPVVYGSAVELTQENTLFILMGQYGRGNKQEKIEKPILSSDQISTCCGVIIEDPTDDQVGLLHISSSTKFSEEISNALLQMFPGKRDYFQMKVSLISGNGDLMIRILDVLEKKKFNMGFVKIDLKKSYLPDQGEPAKISYNTQNSEIFIWRGNPSIFCSSYKERIDRIKSELMKESIEIRKLHGVISKGFKN